MAPATPIPDPTMSSSQPPRPTDAQLAILHDPSFRADMEREVDNDRVSPADPFDFGSGHIAPGKPNQRGSSFQPAG